MLYNTKLFIHIGLHKTATTSFRHMLNNNIFLEFMKSNIKHGFVNVISLEGKIIFIINTKVFNTKVFNDKYNFTNAINALNNYIHTEIIVVLRNQASYIESFYLQQVKTNLMKVKFDEFKKNINYFEFHYKPYIETLSNNFNKVHHFWYEDIFLGELLFFKKFYNIFGIPFDDIK